MHGKLAFIFAVFTGAPGFEPGLLLMLFAALIAGLFLPSAYTRLRKTA